MSDLILYLMLIVWIGGAAGDNLVGSLLLT